MTGIRRLADTKHKKGDKMLKFSYEDRHKYDDIINLPHHVSKTHPRMPIADRAAQFAPFAALTRHGEAVKETSRLTESRIEIDESWKKVNLGEERVWRTPLIPALGRQRQADF